MYCTSCGKEIPDGAKYCSHCGASQETKTDQHQPLTATAKPNSRLKQNLKGWHLLVLGIVAIGTGTYLIGGAVLEIVGFMFLLFSIPVFVREAIAYDKARKQQRGQ